MLNVSYDGKVYESPLSWESIATNRVSAAELLASRIFSSADNTPVAPAAAAPPAAPPLKIPPRDSKAGKQLLDLTKHYNALLTDSWHGGEGNSLASLPTGIQNFGGIDFDVRGLIQLNCQGLNNSKFPTQVTGIKVGQKCKRLHFLHSSCWGSLQEDGQQVASYIVHFVNNPTRLEIPVIYGRDARDWHWQGNEPSAPKELKVVWTGENDDSRRGGHPIRLFLTSWNNLLPEMEVESLDVISNMSRPGLFLLGITAD
jgi:hypothetical protein